MAARNGAQLTIAAIVPALDEEATVAAVVSALRSRVDRVIVADNGSRDRTVLHASRAGAEVVVELDRGYGAACLAGIASLGESVDVVVFCDADGSDDLDALDTLLAPIRDGRADLVIGSRVRHAARGALTPVQRAGNWLAVQLLRRWYGTTATDLGPLRAIRADALRALRMRDRAFGWTVEMQARAALAGLRTVEVDVAYHRRRAGKSKVSGTIRGSIGAGSTILWRLGTLRFEASRR